MRIRRFLHSLVFGPKKTEDQDATAESDRLNQPRILAATAQQLERPCLYLKQTGTELAAVWGGAGIVEPPPGPYRHWISVDNRYLAPNSGLNGVLSVYTNEEDCESGITVFSPTATLIEHNGENLYAHVNRSLPPPDASGDRSMSMILKHLVEFVRV